MKRVPYRNVFTALFFIAGVISLGIGWVQVDRHNRQAKSYWEKQTMYDSPWMAAEFICLGIGVVIRKSGREKGGK